MSTPMLAAAIVLSAAITFGLRALPFLIFSGERKMPDWLQKLGEMLPSAIMAVLIIYCLKDVPASSTYGLPDAPSDFAGTGIQKLLAVLVVAVSYHFKRSTFLSIFLGTAVYMLLLQFF